MSEDAKTVAALNAELQAIDIELRQITEQERESENGIGELALQARRGDREAIAKLDQFDAFCAKALSDRRRLQAARVSVEAELVTALAVIEREAEKARAGEAREINEVFRKRGVDLDAGIRTFVDNYRSLRDDAAALANLGVRSINPELVRVNTLRALSAALQGTDLGLPLVPPLQRHSFSSLVDKWANFADRHIATVLGEPMPATPTNGHDATPAEIEVPPAIIDTTADDPNFVIKPAQPRAP